MNSDELKQLRCPQNWGISDYIHIESTLNEKKFYEEDYSPDDTKYASQVGRFKTSCLLSYENYRIGKYSKALKHLDDTDVVDDFIQKYDRVYKHVSMASRAHVLYKLGSFNLAKEIVNEIKKENYSEVEEAGFKFIEGSMLISYGQCGAQRSVVLIEEALKVIPDEAEFHFCLGNHLGRMRHFSFPFPPPSNKELDALRKAVSLRKDLPQYAIPLARFYMDSRHFLPKDKKSAYIDLAEAIYRNLLKHHNSLCGNDIARCVYNLTKLQRFSDLEEYALMAKKKSNSVLMNHYIGTFFLQLKEYEEALGCFEKASEKLSYLTGLVLLLVYRVNNNSIGDEDIDQHVAKWSELYESSDKDSVNFLLGVSQFYLLVKDDLTNAALYFNNAYKHQISQRHFLNLSSVGGCSNYICTLKDELMKSRLKDVNVLEAQSLITMLPENIVTERNPKILTRHVGELRKTLL